MKDAYTYLDNFNNNEDAILGAYRHSGAIQAKAKRSLDSELNVIDELSWSEYVISLNKKKELKTERY